MPKLIKNGALDEQDPWKILSKEIELDSALAETVSHIVVPLALWADNKDILIKSQKNIGVWLDSDETPQALVDDFDKLVLIALNFPAFTDGRSYTSATTLRQRYQYAGEIRAIGDVLCDQRGWQQNPVAYR